MLPQFLCLAFTFLPALFVFWEFSVDGRSRLRNNFLCVCAFDFFSNLSVTLLWDGRFCWHCFAEGCSGCINAWNENVLVHIKACTYFARERNHFGIDLVISDVCYCIFQHSTSIVVSTNVETTHSLFPAEGRSNMDFDFDVLHAAVGGDVSLTR